MKLAISTLIVCLALVISTSPVYALTHKQQKQQQKHQIHREYQLLKRWMSTVETSCRQFTGDDFHACYMKKLDTARGRTVLLPETNKAFYKLTHNKRKK